VPEPEDLMFERQCHGAAGRRRATPTGDIQRRGGAFQPSPAHGSGVWCAFVSAHQTVNSTDSVPPLDLYPVTASRLVLTSSGPMFTMNRTYVLDEGI
jgi:hypothetical protein